MNSENNLTSNSYQPKLSDYLTLHFVVLIYGFTAILGKLLSIDTIGLVFFRTFLATTGFYIYFKVRGLSIDIDTKGKWQLLATGGIIIALHWFTFFYSAKVSTIAISLAGISTTSLWTSLIEPFMNRTKIKLVEVLLGGVVIFGLYLIFLFEFNHVWGLVLGIIAAITGAVFSVLNGQFAKRYSPQIITFYEMAGVAITTAFPLGYFLMVGDATTKLIPTGLDWLWIIILSLVCTVYAYSKSVDLVRIFSAFTFTLTINLEPVYGIMLAYSIFGEKERMTSGFYLGTLVILGSVLIYPLLRKPNV
ncbi:MAG: DMT family transporter [Arcicella sp.]|jgi:drug/metabolite transporter (DMT)-like permease|nr:DMT family transporter [Arcicella sp.]